MTTRTYLTGLTAVAVLLLTPSIANAASGPVVPVVPASAGCSTVPQPPANLRAVGGFSPNTIMLSWTIVPVSDGCTLAGFDITRAPGTSGGTFTRIAQVPVTTSFTDVQGQLSSTYRYRVHARTTNGLISGPSNTAQATTSDACLPQLPFPLTLAIAGVSATSVSLFWFGTNPRCVVFDVQRATGASGIAFTDIGTTSSSSFTDTTVSPATTYRYRVRARIVTTGLIWGYTSIVTVTTLAVAPVASPG